MPSAYSRRTACSGRPQAAVSATKDATGSAQRVPEPGLPGVIGDANQLIQVFLNLVTNAEQAIREVRDSGRIQVRLANANNRIAITVQDDGVGIRPEALPRIFDPFYTTKRPGGGTGLGLSICMSIIREHGGNIEAETLPAGGTAFTVTLPIAVGQPPELLPAPADSPSEAIRPAAELLKDRTVLVLDDEESIRMLLDEGLSAQGLQVDCVATVEEALTHLKRIPYDVLLCDLHLSSGGFALDGRDAVRRDWANAQRAQASASTTANTRPYAHAGDDAARARSSMPRC
jgi:CheY-like chemotaxis protein